MNIIKGLLITLVLLIMALCGPVAFAEAPIVTLSACGGPESAGVSFYPTDHGGAPESITVFSPGFIHSA